MSVAPHRKRTTCRSCNGAEFVSFLQLGPSPLANSFLKTPAEFEREAFYPLDLYFCRSCSMVQLLDVIDPEVLFRNYVYVSGTSETIVQHYENYAKEAIGFCSLKAGDLVIEIASNDGTLLQNFRQAGMRTLGVEPAENIAAIAAEKEIETIQEFFNFENAKKIRAAYGAAKIVMANNVLAHVDETIDFLQGCRELLSSSGVLIVEVPYLKNLLDRLEYDTVYHEHLSYFSVTAFMRVCDAAGLAIRRVEEVPVHGGSLHVYAIPSENPIHSEEAQRMSQIERDIGLTTIQIYRNFSERVGAGKKALLKLLNDLKSQGKSIAAYGAPAKGNTLLNYCGIGPNLVSFTVDKNPLKVGKLTPGMHLPVLPVSSLLEKQPDYVLILAWNFAEEIMRQQQLYRERGGRFILPIPEPKIL